MDNSIHQKAQILAQGASTTRQVSDRIVAFVRDSIPYRLDEWNVTAEEVLRKGFGMCAGKALLTVALHRALGIPARFKVIKILGEGGLFDFAQRQIDLEPPSVLPAVQRRMMHASIDALPPERDHIVVQVLVDDEWKELDPSRDDNLDNGLKALGIWSPRKVVHEEAPSDSIDGWLTERLHKRTVTKSRKNFFQFMNRQIDLIRRVGEVAEKIGMQSLVDDDIRHRLEDWKLVDGCPVPGSNQGLDQISIGARSALSRLTSTSEKAELEEKLVDWLFSLVRYNVKRGRYWELSDVLMHRQADCLGYARILIFIARDLGLDASVIEVIKDNRGRYVPHSVCFVNLADGRKRLIDPWYASSNIKHRLFAGRIGDRLIPKTVTLKKLQSMSVQGLAPEHITGISFYIFGNLKLAQGNSDEAIECYDISLSLYTGNSRTLFNRATALEGLGKHEEAVQDYERSFATSAQRMRVLGNIEDLESLIQLDELRISEQDQHIFLLRKGFVTGRKETWELITSRCNITSIEARSRFAEVRTKLNQDPTNI